MRWSCEKIALIVVAGGRGSRRTSLAQQLAAVRLGRSLALPNFSPNTGPFIYIMIRSLMTVGITLLVCGFAFGAEVVFHNGKVVTQWNQHPIAQAFLVSDNHFVKVGLNRGVLAAAKPGAKRVDLHGRTVLPGLNDSHTHPIGAALSEFDGPVPVIHSISDVQAYLKKLAAQTQRGSLLFVPKVYSTRLADRRYPTRYELDAAVGEREAMTDNGYASVLNSVLLKRLQIMCDML